MKKLFIMITIFLLFVSFFLGCNPTEIEMKLNSNKQPVDWKKEMISAYCDENDCDTNGKTIHERFTSLEITPELLEEMLKKKKN